MPCMCVLFILSSSALRPLSGIAKLTFAFLQFWLLGYEFPTTLMLFTPETLYILTTQKKGALSQRDTARTSDRARPDHRQ